MGYLNADGQWIPGGSPQEQDRSERAAARRKAAKAAFAVDRGVPERPIEEATRGETNRTRRSARQLLSLTGDEESTRHTLASLALGRQRDDDPQQASERTASMIDEIAERVDDNVEARQAEEDDSELYAAWLEWRCDGLTRDQLNAKVEELGEQDGQALLDMLEDEYERDLEAYYAQDDTAGARLAADLDLAPPPARGADFDHAHDPAGGLGAAGRGATG